MGGDEQCSAANQCVLYNEPINSPPIHTVGVSSEIIEEISINSHQKRQNLAIEIPSRTNEISTEDFMRINMPLTPPRTPKKVNFSPMPSPRYPTFIETPSPSRCKTSMKNLLPRLSFKFRNTNLDIERAAILALGDTPRERKEKHLIRRTLSLSKIFMTRTKKASSLPVTPIAHSNPESLHGGNTSDSDGKGGTSLYMHRSRSVPELNKDGNSRLTKSTSGVYRVVPTTPRAANKPELNTSLTVDSGLVIQMKLTTLVKIFLRKKLFVGSVLLNSERVLRPLNWNAAVKVTWHWPTKIAL